MTTELQPKTTDIIKANFSLELSKLNYQTALQSLTSYVITRDNIVEAQEKIKGARSFLKKFDEIKTAGKAAALAECKAWDLAFNELKHPFDNVLAEKSAKMSKIAQELEEERQDAERESQRVAGIKQAIDNFFIEQSQAIAAAQTTQQLVRIEQFIGSHKANKSRYAEFLPDLAHRASTLADLIKEQKVSIRKLEALQEAEKVAETTGQDQAVLDLREEQQQITAKIEENSIRVQEVAINAAVEGGVTEVEVVAPEAPRPRRQTWEYEINDDIIKGEIIYGSGIKMVAKAMPSWVEMKPIEKKIEAFLAENKPHWKDKEEVEVNGVRFFLKKVY